jgi:uncharacterized protein (DUF488 family)
VTRRTVWTIGHSTRAIEEFLATLGTHGIETIVDVRRFPGSRRLPQFGAAALASALAERGIAYRWIGELGGRRQPDPASPNDAWRHSAFRAYADHMATDEFAAGLFELEMIASGSRSAHCRCSHGARLRGPPHPRRERAGGTSARSAGGDRRWRAGIHVAG